MVLFVLGSYSARVAATGGSRLGGFRNRFVNILEVCGDAIDIAHVGLRRIDASLETSFCFQR